MNTRAKQCTGLGPRPTTHRNNSVNGRYNETDCYSISTFSKIGVQQHLKIQIKYFKNTWSLKNIIGTD